MVDNLLHRINPSAQRNTHQNLQGMTENHQEKIELGHPWVFVTISYHPCFQMSESLVTSYDSCKGNIWK
jgi:hypothetical protein